MTSATPTPRTDSAMQGMIDGSGLPAPALVQATKGLYEEAQRLERELAHHKKMIANIRGWLKGGATISAYANHDNLLVLLPSGTWDCAGVSVDCKNVKEQKP